MEIIFQTTKLLGLDETTAYQTVFFAQVAAVLAALGLFLGQQLLRLMSRPAVPTVAAPV